MKYCGACAVHMAEKYEHCLRCGSELVRIIRAEKITLTVGGVEITGFISDSFIPFVETLE